MLFKNSGASLRTARAALVAAACALVIAMPSSDSRAQAPAYSIDFHVITASAKRARNNCFILRGTAGQAAPGYSSGGGYSILAGFWSAAPLQGQDEIFFDSFEEC